MPMRRSLYPPNWHAFSHAIRFIRAQAQCECTGQCGMHRPNPHTRRCVETHGQPARFARGTIHLTVAHLCHCAPPCAIAAHVIAACQRCHLRIDRALHAHSRALRPHPAQSPNKSVGYSGGQGPTPSHLQTALFPEPDQRTPLRARTRRHQ